MIRWLLVMALVVGCSSSTRLKTLDATLAALDSAKIGLTSLEPQLEQDIVDKATSHEDGAAKLKAWRAKRDKVLVSLKAAFDALSDAFKLDTDVSMANAIAVAAAVQAQLKGLGL